jgi:ubiquitin carboxyl-terminal hydrolase 14
MMGTPTEKATTEPPKEKIVFLEDLSIGAAAAAGKVLPPGLHNLGNTCYLNATVQVLRGAPELVSAISSAPITGGSREMLIPSELKKLYNEMEKTANAEVVPARFVAAIRSLIPRFNEKSPRGDFLQQDADEFYNELMGALSRTLTTAQKSIVDDYFGIELSVKTKCLESDQEPVTESGDSMRRLQCIINENIAHLSAGLKLGLEGELEKHSDILGRDARFHQTKRLARCPKYMVVQLNRFFWKRTPESMDHRGVNCKILRSVKFPQMLDVFELCDDRVQSVLKVQRDLKASKVYDAKKAKPATEEADGATSSDPNGDSKMEDEDAELQKALALSMVDEEVMKAEEVVLGKDVPSAFSGRYELVGVVSHKGRSSSSGHYMGWVRNPKNPAKWTCFDDDHPSECEWKDIDNLAGGGDHHMAFMLLYRASTE